jgi:hypothetical protein
MNRITVPLFWGGWDLHASAGFRLGLPGVSGGAGRDAALVTRAVAAWRGNAVAFPDQTRRRLSAARPSACGTFVDRLRDLAIQARDSACRCVGAEATPFVRAHLAGCVGPEARLFARHKQSSGLFVSGLALQAASGQRPDSSPGTNSPQDCLCPGSVLRTVCVHARLAGRAGPVARPFGRRKPSTGRFTSGLSAFRIWRCSAGSIRRGRARGFRRL